MKIRWYCKKCDRNCEIQPNLRAKQMDFTIKTVECYCDDGHPTTVEVKA